METEAFDDTVLDTLIVMGTLLVESFAPGLLAYVRNASAKIRRVASICTGAPALAEAGLLDGRRVTTHWAYARDLQARFPTLKVGEDRIFIIDGSIWGSAGCTACIDLALAMVERMLEGKWLNRWQELWLSFIGGRAVNPNIQRYWS